MRTLLSSLAISTTFLVIPAVILLATQVQAAEINMEGSKNSSMQHNTKQHNSTQHENMQQGQHPSLPNKQDSLDEPMMHDAKDRPMQHGTSMPNVMSTQHNGKSILGKKSLLPPLSKLSVLDEIPPSGLVREGGYDGRYVMESTSAYDTLADQCAKASRGLVIMDNKTWQKCSKKTLGITKAKK